MAPGVSASLDPDGTGASAVLAELGFGAPTDRMNDLAHRLYRAMRDYRGRPLDVHLVIVRSAESNASAHDEPWSRLARGAELHVLPGDHVTLVTEAGGERFAAVIRGVIDRATARGDAA